jgi:hypothetical protein
VDDIYKRVADYSDLRPEAYAQVQRIVWYMRHGRPNDKVRVMQLQPEDNALLERLSPGSTERLKARCKKVNWKDIGLSSLKDVFGDANSLQVRPTSWADADRRTPELVSAMDNMPLKEMPLPDNDSDYSMLQGASLYTTRIKAA